MSDYIIGSLITGAFALALWLLGRVSGGARKDKAETDASVAAQWQAWSQEQGRRIDALEEDVAELKRALAEERDQNERKSQLLRLVIEWALRLRDQVVGFGGDPAPAHPEVTKALTKLDP